MSIFSNIHKIASRLIPLDRIEWRNPIGTEISPAGISMMRYTDWIEARAHIEPGIVSSFGSKNLSEKEYEDLGLNWSRRTFTIWVSDTNITTTATLTGTSQLRFYGSTFNVIQIADWEVFNGWKRVYCEEQKEEGV